MKTKFTPGPWGRRFGNYVYLGEDGEGRLICTAQPSDKSHEDWQETFANARLIAQAPAMYTAMKNLYVDACDRGENCDDNGEEYDDWRQIRLILEKIEGGGAGE